MFITDKLCHYIVKNIFKLLMKHLNILSVKNICEYGRTIVIEKVRNVY